MASNKMKAARNGVSNGLASNGFATNGVATNGVSNGLASNGFATNGVSTNGHSNGKASFNGHSVANGNGHAAVANGNGHAETEGTFIPFTNRSDAGVQFLYKAVDFIIQEAIVKGYKSDGKVVEFVHPAELEKRIDLALPSEPTSQEDLMAIAKDVIRYSVKTGHPHFFNQLFGGIDPYGLTGAWLSDALNASQYTYEVAPVFTIMEKVVFAEMRKLIGFETGDGMFCPGGSISNMYAISLARYQKFPDIKNTGLSGLPKLCIMTSEKSHYSIKKAAAFMGLGMDNVISIKTNKFGRMIPQELEAALERVKSEGRVPFVVNATAATTVFGAYDPLHAIADICQKHDIWLHVDAAWGGGVLLSEKLRTKMDGVERADSVTWNPHKMMGAPLQASTFFTRHNNLLAACHSAKAQYLFQQDKFYDVSYDTGDKSIQCGRKVDVLKVWMMWRARGTEQYGRDVEFMFHCAQHLAKKLASTDGFRLVLEKPECTNVCFWYIPPSLRGQTEDAEWWNRLAKVAPVIKKRMVEQGTLLVGYQPDGDLVNFFRMVISNLTVTEEDMDFVVDEIARLGNDL